jgi:NAD(P)-dependent dehydrogenase (short-subunit alcohol dehydrogenase family)
MTKTALIWGASGGIGSALVDALSGRGWQVAAVARDIEPLLDRTTLAFEADLSRPSSVQAAVMALGQEVDQIDWWIYSAGAITSMPVQEMKPDLWQKIMDANLTGVYHAAHYSLALLSKEAPVYILGAVSERMRLPGLTAYAAAKAGVEAFAAALRKELRRTVVVIRPGAVRTELWQDVPFKMPAGALDPGALADLMIHAYERGEKGPFVDA